LNKRGRLVEEYYLTCVPQSGHLLEQDNDF